MVKKKKSTIKKEKILLYFNSFGILFSLSVFIVIPDLINKLWSAGIPFLLCTISIYLTRRNFKVSLILTGLAYILFLILIYVFFYVFYIDKSAFNFGGPW